MTINGIKLESRGQEKVVMADHTEVRRTVYCVPNEWKFYIKTNGELVEVFHKSCWFSVNP